MNTAFQQKIAAALLARSRKGLVGIADQAVFSGAMFVLNILLARWTSIEEFGVFAVLFAVFLIVAGFHNALILEPMTIFGAQEKSTESPHYFKHTMVLHFGLIVLLATITAIALIWVDSDSIGDARWVLPVCIPCVLTFWTVRRYYYVTGQPGRALGMSSVYAITLITCMALLFATANLDSQSAFMGLAATTLLVSFVPCLRILSGVNKPEKARVQWREFIARHWRYGRWALGESIAFALGISLLPLLLAYFSGVSRAGELRALQILFLPLSHVLTGLGLLALPALVRVYHAHRAERFRVAGMLLVAGFGAISVAYVLPVLLATDFVIDTLYASTSFHELSWIVPYLAIAAVLTGVSSALMMILRAVERPDLVFVATAIVGLITVTTAPFLLAYFGDTGLVVALLTSAMVGTLILLWNARHTLALPLPASQLQVVDGGSNVQA